MLRNLHKNINMGYMKIILLTVIFSIFTILEIDISKAIANPSAIYCEGLGYEYIIISEGIGICKINNNISVNAWDFYNGKVAAEYGICARYNATEITADDKNICNGLEFCQACEFPNGTIIAKSLIMKLSGNFSLRGGYCGDGVCQFYHENYIDCPQDCPTGSRDMICDGIKDGRCDSDCITQNIADKDPDCIANKTQTKTQICDNNSICEPLRGENVNNCPSDCHCGNGICEREYEEELYCQIDCDNQVDQPSKMKFIIYGIIISLTILLIVYIIKSSKGETE